MVVHQGVQKQANIMTKWSSMSRNKGKLLTTHINPTHSSQWAVFSCILSESQKSSV